MINGDVYGREMWIAFHSIAAKYVLLSKLLTLTLIVQSTLLSFQLQSVGYSWLGGFPSLQIPSAIRIRNSWVSGHPRGDQILRGAPGVTAPGISCTRHHKQGMVSWLCQPHQPLRGDEITAKGALFWRARGCTSSSSSSAISSRLMSSSITLPHVTCDFPVDDVDVETVCHWSRGSLIFLSPRSCFFLCLAFWHTSRSNYHSFGFGFGFRSSSVVSRSSTRSSRRVCPRYNNPCCTMLCHATVRGSGSLMSWTKLQHQVATLRSWSHRCDMLWQ